MVARLERAALPVALARLKEIQAGLAAAGVPHAWAGTAQPPELDDLRAVLKAWLFFVRAFCDRAYALAFLNSEGHLPGRQASMNDAAKKPENPVARALASRAPDVIPWFIAFRDRRNDLKDGFAFAFLLSPDGLTAAFYVFAVPPRVEIDARTQRTVSTRDLVKAADCVCELLRLLDEDAS
jgi:hypothetical protein